MEKQDASNWWYILPLLFGLIGGVISYIIIRKEDKAKASRCLALGIFTVICILLFLATFS